MISREIIRILAQQYTDKIKNHQDLLSGVQNLCKHPEVKEVEDHYHRPAQACTDCGKTIWPHQPINSDTIWND